MYISETIIGPNRVGRSGEVVFGAGVTAPISCLVYSARGQRGRIYMCMYVCMYVYIYISSLKQQ